MEWPDQIRTTLPALALLCALSGGLACGQVEQDGGAGSGGTTGSGGAAGSGGSGDVILTPYACNGQPEWGLDADGDGFAGPINYTAVECVTGEPPPEGYPPPDCDDTDPTAWGLGFFDQDGDGYAGVDSAVCIGDIIPPDAMSDATDCDDDDSAVHPDAADFPGDELDTNCDGIDGGAPNDPDVPDPFMYESGDVLLTIPCTAVGEQYLYVIFGWRGYVCTTPDGVPLGDIYERATVTFRSHAPDPLPAVTAVLTSDLDEDWTLELEVPALAPDEATATYLLGEIPGSVALTIESLDGTSCADVPFETSALGTCVVD